MPNHACPRELLWSFETSSDVVPVDEPRGSRDEPLRHNRDYMLLWGGQAISTTGTVVSGIAFPLLTLAITHSPLQAGIVGGLERLPFPVFGLLAGALIDRWDRKRVMIISDAVRALAVGSIPIAIALGHLVLLQLYLVALVEGTAFVLFDLARVSALPRVVPKQRLAAATAQNEASYAAAALIAPPIGGALFHIAKALPFVVDAISYTASVASLFFVKSEFSNKSVLTSRTMKEDIVEGIVWLWRRPVVRLLAFLSGAINVVFATAALTVIVLIQEQHGTATTIGLVFGGAAVGGILGQVVAGLLLQWFEPRRVVLAVFGFLVVVAFGILLNRDVRESRE